MPDSRRGARAFTLVEMLVAIALLAVISGLLFSALDQVMRATTAAQGKSTLYQDARFILDQMGRELQQAMPEVRVIAGNQTNVVFWAGTDGTMAEMHFVAIIDNNRGHDEAEVHYVYDGSNILYKSIVFYGATNASNAALWDFDSSSSWWDTPTFGPPREVEYVPVLQGVKSMTFQFFTNGPPDPATMFFATNWNAVTVLPGRQAEIPAYVRVTVQGYDAHVIRQWKSADKVGKDAGGNVVNASARNLSRSYSILVCLPQSAN